MVVVGIFVVVLSVFVNGFVWGIWLDLFGFVLNYVLDCEWWPWLLVGGGGQWLLPVGWPLFYIGMNLKKYIYIILMYKIEK